MSQASAQPWWERQNLNWKIYILVSVREFISKKMGAEVQNPAPNQVESDLKVKAGKPINGPLALQDLNIFLSLLLSKM